MLKSLARRFMKNFLYPRHPIYNKIYPPYYDKNYKIDNNYPIIYKKNENGEYIKQELYFLRDDYFPCNPYGNSDYFLFDRYNIELNTHFYTHDSMLETIGHPKKKYGLLIESESIVPKSFKIFNKYKNLYKEFNAIFTFNDKILNKIPNAKFFPYFANFWYNDQNVKNLSIEERLKLKTKKISMMSSNKTMCDLHKFRIATALYCKNNKLADTFGTFDGGNYININETLTNYKFSIIIENDTTPYFFTEKITNCFASLTIPIYLGATEIDKFFNPDGIIKIKTNSNIEQILKNCTSEFYNERLDAILDNYNRVQEYKNSWNYLYKHYLE